MIVIFNPVAGRRRTQSLWRVLDILAANGVRIDLVKTEYAGHAKKLARAAAMDGAPVVVAAGGDGTIAEVANGLSGSSAKLGVIPIGTANVLAHELALPFVPVHIASALAFGRTRPLWPGMLVDGNAPGLFVQMVGVGFDGHVVHTLPPLMKQWLGRGAYVLQTLRALRTYPFEPVSLCIDGQETQTISAIVSKGRFYGGPFALAGDACPERPGFSVSLFDRPGPMAALLCAALLPLGYLCRAPGVRQLHAREIVFTGNGKRPVQSDGDAAGVTPLRVIDAPTSIPVIVG